jgi:small subunit ribosomal protein S1
MVSHSKVWEQSRADEREAEAKSAQADADNTKKAVKNIQSKVEKATLGDLGALADLKNKMKSEEEGK